MDVAVGLRRQPAKLARLEPAAQIQRPDVGHQRVLLVLQILIDLVRVIPQRVVRRLGGVDLGAQRFDRVAQLLHLVAQPVVRLVDAQLHAGALGTVFQARFHHLERFRLLVVRSLERFDLLQTFGHLFLHLWKQGEEEGIALVLLEKVAEA